MHTLLPRQWPLTPASELAEIAPCQPIHFAPFQKAGIHVAIKREDLLHPLIGGNKVYKLIGHLQQWHLAGANQPIASFGGAFSNHLLALAAAGNDLGIPTVGVVRGERPAVLSPTLHDAQTLGMTLHFLSRSEYRQKTETFIRSQVEATQGVLFWVPEGGGGAPGLVGCKGLAATIVRLYNPDVVCHACGTGASLAGIALGLSEHQTAIGVPVVKGDVTPMREDMARWMAELAESRNNWRLVEGFHCGGYAKRPPYLAKFIKNFQQSTGIALDAVYTAKLMNAIIILAEQGFWPRGTQIVVVHSGGLQGNRGYSWEV